MAPLERVGPYRIEAQLGTGGMGSVYRAVHEETGQVVAIKMLHPHLADDSELLTRFEREARVASDLRSPFVVATLGYARRPPYIVMELIEGETLAALLRRNGPMPVGDWLRLGMQVAEGLAAAHTAGIVHRDISPHNILVTRDFVAKLSDFGVARVSGATAMTETAAFLGKPAYAAPEVFSGVYDARTDIYAFGVTMYEALTGEPAFRGSTPMALMRAHQESHPPRLDRARRDVPPAMAAIVDRCLQKAPEDRYQNAAALLADLQLVSAYPQLPPEQLTASRMRNRPARRPLRRYGQRPLWLAVPFLATLVVAGVALIWLTTRGEPQARGAQAGPSPTALRSQSVSSSAGDLGGSEPTGAPPIPTQPPVAERSVIEGFVRQSNDVYIAAFRDLNLSLLSTVYADDALQYYANQLASLIAQGVSEQNENTVFSVNAFASPDADHAHLETYEAWTWFRPGAASIHDEYTEQYNLERRSGRWLITCNSFQSVITGRRTASRCE